MFNYSSLIQEPEHEPEIYNWVDVSPFNNTARKELDTHHIISELRRIDGLLNKNPPTRSHLEAKFIILKYVINCAMNDPQAGDYYNRDNKESTIDAGHMLNELGGLKIMRYFFQTWISTNIPKRYHREIELYWDGIGGWRG